MSPNSFSVQRFVSRWIPFVAQFVQQIVFIAITTFAKQNYEATIVCNLTSTQQTAAKYPQ